MRAARPILACLALAACGPGDEGAAPGPAGAGEARALREAAEMIARGRPPSSPDRPVPSAPSPGASELVR